MMMSLLLEQHLLKRLNVLHYPRELPEPDSGVAVECAGACVCVEGEGMVHGEDFELRPSCTGKVGVTGRTSSQMSVHSRELPVMQPTTLSSQSSRFLSCSSQKWNYYFYSTATVNTAICVMTSQLVWVPNPTRMHNPSWRHANVFGACGSLRQLCNVCVYGAKIFPVCLAFQGRKISSILSSCSFWRKNHTNQWEVWFSKNISAVETFPPNCLHMCIFWGWKDRYTLHVNGSKQCGPGGLWLCEEMGLDRVNGDRIMAPRLSPLTSGNYNISKLKFSQTFSIHSL